MQSITPINILKNILIFPLHFPVTIFRENPLKMILESITEILVYFYNISIGVIDCTYQHHVKASRYFVCDQTLKADGEIRVSRRIFTFKTLIYV